MASRKNVDETVEGYRVMVMELEFCDAADLLPELAAVMAPGYAAATNDDATVGKAIASMAVALTGGKLSALLPRILKATTVIVPDEADKLIKIELGSRDSINRAFTGRKKLAIGVIKLTLEVNFRDFFDGLDLSDLAIQKP